MSIKFTISLTINCHILAYLSDERIYQSHEEQPVVISMHEFVVKELRKRRRMKVRMLFQN